MPAELKMLLRARYPLVWLVTSEEQRAVEIACAEARRAGDAIAGWSSTWGLHDLPGPPQPGAHRDPLAVLDSIRKQERRTIWVLKDLSLLAAEPHNVALARSLRDTAQICKERGSVLLCVGNEARVPPALAGEAAVHTLELPDEAEHLAQLRDVARQLSVPVADGDARLLARACLGLTLEQAENIWARIRAAGGRFTAADVGEVLAEKRRIVRG
ncbi:MAG: hypothetical protein D6798_04690, partial [Deltaproteobacteria bacterium]